MQKAQADWYCVCKLELLWMEQAGKLPSMLTSAPTCDLTAEEFCRLADEGAFGVNTKVELLDGEVFEMLPAGPFHGYATMRLNNYFAWIG